MDTHSRIIIHINNNKDVDRDAGGGTGSARRRRERRLRAYLKYARMSVAMTLAESRHHSEKTARAGGGFEKKYTAKFRKHPPARSPARGTSTSTTTTACQSSKARGLTASPASGPQERVPRRIVEQIVDSAPVLPLLHAPVPQTVDSVGEVLRALVQKTATNIILVQGGVAHATIAASARPPTSSLPHGRARRHVDVLAVGCLAEIIDVEVGFEWVAWRRWRGHGEARHVLPRRGLHPPG